MRNPVELETALNEWAKDNDFFDYMDSDGDNPFNIEKDLTIIESAEWSNKTNGGIKDIVDYLVEFVDEYNGPITDKCYIQAQEFISDLKKLAFVKAVNEYYIDEFEHPFDRMETLDTSVPIAVGMCDDGSQFDIGYNIDDEKIELSDLVGVFATIDKPFEDMLQMLDYAQIVGEAESFLEDNNLFLKENER